jgi:hypothetical protein
MSIQNILVLSLTLAIAACGGGGGSSSDQLRTSETSNPSTRIEPREVLAPPRAMQAPRGRSELFSCRINTCR